MANGNTAHNNDELSPAELKLKQGREYERFRKSFWDAVDKMPETPADTETFEERIVKFAQRGMKFNGKELLHMLREAGKRGESLSGNGNLSWFKLYDNQKIGSPKDDQRFERRMLILMMMRSYLKRGESKEQAYRELSDKWGFPPETIKKDYLAISKFFDQIACRVEGELNSDNSVP